MSSLDVKKSGTIWEKKAHQILIKEGEAAREEAAKFALNYQKFGTAVFKNPTGNYYSSLMIENLIDSDLITAKDIAYNRWLESGGEGTRFGGYYLWRKTFDATVRYVEKAAETAGRMGAKKIDA